MNTSTTTEPTQEQLRAFVDREVIYCASMLISELSSNDKYMDELLEVQSQDDWEEPVNYHVYSDMDSDELAEYLDEYDIDYKQTDSTLIRSQKLNDYLQENDDDLREFADREGLDPHQREALEHWIVSNWLADKLEAQGEMILRDFMGLTIWGRTCSGQAILLDGVITTIWKSIQ